MLIYAEKTDLVDALNKVSKFAGSKRASHLPILSCIRLSAEDGMIRIAATNLNSGIECVIEADVEEGGAVAIHANYLVETVKRFIVVPGN